jgi:hypothetical protein
LEYILGDGLGSPQWAAVALGGEKFSSKEKDEKKTLPVVITPLSRIVYYEEGKRLMQQDSVGHGSERGLVTMFTQLFESNEHATGSFAHGAYSVKAANVSLLLHFTRTDFEKVFTGSGATSSGFLSRCTLISEDPNAMRGVWRTVSSARVKELVHHLQTCLQRKELTQEDGVEGIRQMCFDEIAQADHLHGARLQFLFAQDLYARGMFSNGGVITEEAASQARLWTLHQLWTRARLWPLDQSSDRYERVYMTLIKAFEKTPVMALRDMKKVCHSDRAGSGGIQALTSTLRSMLSAGDVVKEGRNRSGKELFKWVG